MGARTGEAVAGMQVVGEEGTSWVCSGRPGLEDENNSFPYIWQIGFTGPVLGMRTLKLGRGWGSIVLGHRAS